MIAQFTRGAKPVEVVIVDGVQHVRRGPTLIPCPAPLDEQRVWGTWQEYHAAQRRVEVVEE